jgi:hypothetical protein
MQKRFDPIENNFITNPILSTFDRTDNINSVVFKLKRCDMIVNRFTITTYTREIIIFKFNTVYHRWLIFQNVLESLRRNSSHL